MAAEAGTVRGLTYYERRALLIDPSAAGEPAPPDRVFEQLISDGRGFWGPSGFTATAQGELALRVCPEAPR